MARFAGGFQPVIGAAISIRALRADDFEIEEAFLKGLSPETLGPGAFPRALTARAERLCG
jgi:hypothetical protein